MLQICGKCESEFERKGDGRGQYRYCKNCRESRAGAQARYQREMRERRAAERSPNVCRDCGVEFRALRSDTPRCAECKIPRDKDKFKRYEAKQDWHCIDCGTRVTRRSKRCKTCGNREKGLHVRGPNNHLWKGGRTKTRGYIYIRVKPPGFKGHPYRAEHRVVWEQTHGKPIPKGWVVHHLNGVKDDNRPENLAAMPRHEHHSHPRRALEPYEARILDLEAQRSEPAA